MSNETTAIASYRPQALTLETLTLVQQLAPIMHASRLFGTSSDQQSAAIMLKGFELGIPMTAAFEFIQNFDGKIALTPRGALALVEASGVMVDMVLDETPGTCTVMMKRRGGISYTLTWTLDDAKRAQLTEGSPTSSGKRGYGNWEKYQANMLRWRCIGYVIDVLFSDVTGGLKRADEFGATLDEGGNVASAPAQLASYTPPVVFDAVTGEVLA